MKKVDEVYPLDINTTIGPTGTIKRLFQNRDYFSTRGYEMSILASVPISKNILTYNYELRELSALPGEKNSGIMTDTINAPGKKSRLKSKLKTLFERNRFTSAANIRRKERLNRRLIKAYLSMKRTPDIIVFHEASSCYHYYKMFNGELTPKSAMFIHADGTDDGMFCKSHPSWSGRPLIVNC